MKEIGIFDPCNPPICPDDLPIRITSYPSVVCFGDIIIIEWKIDEDKDKLDNITKNILKVIYKNNIFTYPNKSSDNKECYTDFIINDTGEMEILQFYVEVEIDNEYYKGTYYSSKEQLSLIDCTKTTTTTTEEPEEPEEEVEEEIEEEIEEEVEEEIEEEIEEEVVEEVGFTTRHSRITGYAPLDPRAKEGMCYSGNPNVTASGSQSREGIVATNYLPFGTKIRIPELFGDRVFIVEDRMSSKYQNTIDILFDSQDDAYNLGVRWATVEILDE